MKARHQRRFPRAPVHFLEAETAWLSVLRGALVWK
jgi:hypothetical protein